MDNSCQLVSSRVGPSYFFSKRGGYVTPFEWWFQEKKRSGKGNTEGELGRKTFISSRPGVE